MFLKWAVIMIAVSSTVFLSNILRKSGKNAWRLEEVIQKWEAEDLPASITWKAQEFLAKLDWLGPLRPEYPHDPLKVCRISAERNWWVLLLRTTKTRQQLSCLEENILKAEKAHSAFKRGIAYFLALFPTFAAKIFEALFVRTERSARTEQEEDGADTTHLVEDNSESKENLPSTDTSEVVNGSVSPPQDTITKESGIHEKMSTDEIPTEESETTKGDTEEGGGTSIVEIPLGPHGSVGTTVTDTSPSMSDEEEQQMADLHTLKDKATSAGLIMELEQLFSEIWKSGLDSGNFTTV